MSKNYCKFEKKWCNCCTNHGCTYLCGKCAPSSSADNFKLLKTCPKRQNHRTISVKELIDNTPFDDIWNAMVQWFPKENKNKNGYKKTYNELKELKPKKFDNSDKWYLVVKPTTDGRNENPYIDVYLRKVRNTTDSYSVACMSWENILYCNIDPIHYNIIKDLDVPSIIAGILYEITFFGYTQEEIKENLKWTKNIA